MMLDHNIRYNFRKKKGSYFWEITNDLVNWNRYTTINEIIFCLCTNDFIENDTQLLKYNYGSRQGYSVENAILEKRLLLELNYFDKEHLIYTFSNLEACYNLQLPNYGGMIQESICIYCDLCILFLKLIPRFQHHLSTGYGISENSYGSIDCLLCSSGQGNIFSWAVCRYQLCFVFKYMENKNNSV